MSNSTDGRCTAPVSPLAHVTVLDLGTYIAGPLACTHLASLGANVIAVRRPLVLVLVMHRRHKQLRMLC